MGAVLAVGPKRSMLPGVGVGHGAVGLSVLCDNSCMKVHRHGRG